MTLGGTASMLLGVMVNPLEPMTSTLEGALSFSPVLLVDDPLWRLELSTSLHWGAGERAVTLALDRLSVSLALADSLTVSLGRFAYLPGAAGISSVTNWFVAQDLLSLLTGRREEAVLAGDLIQLGLTWGELTLRLTVAPFAPSSPELDAGSPWLPMRSLPKSLRIPFPDPPTDTYLSEVLVEAADAGPPRLKDFALGAELGASSGLLDLSVLAYHGPDNTVLYRPRFSFPGGIWSDYEIILAPVERTIDAFGLDATLAWRSLSAWVDCAFTFSKTFLSRRLSIVTYESEILESPCLEYAVGASWELGMPRLSLRAGYRGEWLPERTPTTIEPLLASRIEGDVSLRLWDERVGLSALAVFSTVDWSAVVVAALSLSPSNELSVNLTVPVFLGEPYTELGQFSANHLVTLQATARF